MSITYFNLTRECLVQFVTILENHGSKTRKLRSKVTFESNFASTVYGTGFRSHHNSLNLSFSEKGKNLVRRVVAMSNKGRTLLLLARRNR